MPYVEQGGNGGQEGPGKGVEPTAEDSPQTRVTMIPKMSISEFQMPTSKVFWNLFHVKLEQDPVTKDMVYS